MTDRHRSMEFLSVLLCIFITTTITIVVHSAPPPSSFSPVDNFLIDCGATTVPTLPDGRIFKSDPQSTGYLSSKDDKKISIPTADVPSPIYLTARIFSEQTSYSFTMSRPGWHWIRLHFFPMNNSEFDLTKSVFSVTTDELVLLHSFNIDNSTKWVMKEYIVNVTTPHLNIHFSPMKNSFAFINAIEVVSAPDILISDMGTSLIPIGDFSGLSTKSYQTVYRLNVGGPIITSSNDTLGRSWDSDHPYLKARALAKSVSVSPGIIKYPQGVSPLIAPNWVYATAVEMGDSRVSHPNFNVTWGLEIDPAFGYLIRLHFCDIVSKALNDLYFNVYINGNMAISGLDLSTLTSDLAVPYYKDYVVNASMLSDMLQIQIGPFKQDTGAINAILNGLEVLKMSNSVGSLDGEFGVDGAKAETKSNRTAVAAVGFAMMFGAFAGLGAMVFKWYKRPHDWERRNSFSSWLLPLHAGNSTFMTSKHSLGSNTKSGYPNFYSSTMGLGRYFSLAELQEATKNFDQNAVIGVGGFGNVYIGDLDDGTKVAVKRGNPQSEQGITEFQTEIQMLSKLRHRHLVSLIGYCDENSEMILVYEFMSNGPLRDHLYGKDLPPLSWKQRLEVSIGAARGLHYLHTGAAQGIIHRDVKTTNILLDENFVAKMSDFGLSKNAPTMEQGHVSTAVKGSFGYLDPEYFRRQQLTDKSDVYSFGVVLFEVLCARPAINPQLPREQVNLAEWAMQWKRKGLLEKIVDPHIAGSINPESMKKFAEAAEKCLAEYGVDRPSMGDVLWNLEYALQLQESSSQGKTEEENKAVAAPSTSAVASSSVDDQPISLAGEDDENPAQVHAVAEHSGTAMFTHLSEISGR
ncbi:Protein kinase domain [Macleaya cordata]|uniref:Protein kinase domain n=1 Tax=Macleaya cordata TaxID=56857 RepID=A0A200R0A3_MACCD|nr:Protein kinase domain [Macleaya cordata]